MKKQTTKSDYLVTAYNKKNNIQYVLLIEKSTASEAKNKAEVVMEGAASLSVVKVEKELKLFAKKWGQDDSEIACNLELDEDDGLGETLMNLGYVWIEEQGVWIPENNSSYDEKDECIVEYIKAHR